MGEQRFADVASLCSSAAYPSDRTEDVRVRLREKAVHSTYFMAKAVLGFGDITPACHGPFCEFMDSLSTRKYGLAPRDHLKTSLWTIADCARRIAGNPNIRILLANETATNAQHMLRRIEAIFERCEAYRWLFPELIPDFSKVKKWSETEMLVPRTEDYPESTIETIGVGGAVVSRHFNLIKLDDLVGKEASESDEVMRKTIDWYQYCESLLNAPNEEIHVYGTRWSYRDLYSWVDEHEPYVDAFFRSAIDADGSALWPERFDLEALDRIKQKVGAFKFSCQYLNKPYDPEGTSFKPEWLNYFRLDGGDCVPEIGSPTSIARMRRFMRVDPAISESDRAARTAIVVDGVDSLDRKFLLETWAKRCQPSDMFEEIFRLYRKWHCESVWIEAVAYQKCIRPFLVAECERRGVWLNVQEVKPDRGKAKPARIRGVQPYFQRGEIFIQRSQDEFKQEYIAFPDGQTVDLLDAFAYGPYIWGGPDENETDTYGEDEYWHEECSPDSGFAGTITGY
jgi:predicted phage terminase large subunit-like protein